MMIKLTRIDGSKININPLQIEMIEKKTNTVIRMMNEVMYIVVEEPEEINEIIREEIKRIVDFCLGGKNG